MPLALDGLPALPPLGSQSELNHSIREAPVQPEKGGKNIKAQAHFLSYVHSHIFAAWGSDPADQVLLH